LRPKTKVEILAELQGHKVIYLPPYMPDWSAIELAWARVKNWVAEHNITFDMNIILNTLLP